jgi:hypothetical protein
MFSSTASSTASSTSSQPTQIETNLASYKILFFILCRRRLSSPITLQDKQDILAAINNPQNPFINYPLTQLLDESIYPILASSKYEKQLLDSLKLIPNSLYESYVRSYEEFSSGNKEYLRSFFDNHSILYAAITNSYKKPLSELSSKDLIYYSLFSFCLLQAYVFNGYLFDLNSYGDINIMRKLLREKIKRNEIFLEIQHSNNYSYLYDNFIAIKLMEISGGAFHVFKTILNNLNVLFEKRYRATYGDLTLVQQRKYTLILYLMGINLLKQFMEIQSVDNDILHINEDIDQTSERQLKLQLEEQINSFISKTSIGNRGQAGGSRRRRIRLLKSYK